MILFLVNPIDMNEGVPSYRVTFSYVSIHGIRNHLVLFTKNANQNLNGLNAWQTIQYLKWFLLKKRNLL